MRSRCSAAVATSASSIMENTTFSRAVLGQPSPQRVFFPWYDRPGTRCGGWRVSAVPGRPVEQSLGIEDEMLATRPCCLALPELTGRPGRAGPAGHGRGGLSSGARRSIYCPGVNTARGRLPAGPGGGGRRWPRLYVRACVGTTARLISPAAAGTGNNQVEIPAAGAMATHVHTLTCNCKSLLAPHCFQLTPAVRPRPRRGPPRW